MKYKLPENWEDNCDGQNCMCNAWNEGECGCSANWTLREVYELRAEVNELREALENLYRNGCKQGWFDSYELDMAQARSALKGKEG